MRIFSLLPLLFVATAACDYITVPSRGDAGPDSLASQWEQVDAGPTNFNAVAGSLRQCVRRGRRRHDPALGWTALLPEASGTTANLRGVAVASDTLTYAVGEQGTILRRQNGVWSADVLSPTPCSMLCGGRRFGGCRGRAGSRARVCRRRLDHHPNPRTDNYYAITNSNDGLDIVGSLGVVSHVDITAGSISAVSLPGYTKLLAGATRWATGAYFVVSRGLLFLGRGYSHPGGRSARGFPARSVGGDGDVWVVGNQGFVAKLPGGQNPTIIPTPDQRWLVSVYAASSSDLWIVGRSGAILRGPPGVRVVGDGGMR